MGNLNKLPNIWIVYKGVRKNSKPKLQVFTDTRVDDIIEMSKKSPLVPINVEIIDVGIGDGFEEIFKKKHKI